MAKLPFHVKPFIIGMVHVGPLPGTPLYRGDLSEIIENAIKDSKTLEEGGVDGIIIENFNDRVYRTNRADPAVISSMTLIVNEVKKEVSIPIGVNVLRDCVLDSIAIAYVTKSSFIRVNALVETVDTPEGILRPSAYRLNMYRSLLKAWNIAILADIHVKHGKPLTKRDIDVVAKEAIERGLADAVIVTGRITGEAIDLNDLIKVKRAVNAPVIIGSGLNPNNVKELLRHADGAIVGTYFKVNGRVSIEKVKRFMNVVKELRREFG